MSKVTIKIERYNPEIDRVPSIATYVLEVGADATILDCLETIKSDFDGTLTYRRSCRHAICGSCAMNINGQNMLVCNQPIIKHLNRRGEIIIRPLPSLPVIKDLVVDRTRFWDQYLRVKPWLVPVGSPPEKEYRMSPEEVAALLDAEKCIMCGACFSACPIVGLNPNYVGPHALQKEFMRIMDPRDGATSARMSEMEQHDGIYGCRTVGSCIDDCPKGLNPTQTISTLRQLALKRQRFEAEKAARQKTLIGEAA